MLITITSEIILFYIVYLVDSALLQCRIGLISEVIVIGIVNPMPLFPSLFLQSYPLIFFQKVFVLVHVSSPSCSCLTCTVHVYMYAHINEHVHVLTRCNVEH